MIDHLNLCIERCHSSGSIYAAMIIDLDRFKVLNDSMGHSAGDILLKAVARRLEECVRGNDTVARMGGDVFVILLDDITDATDAVRICQRFRQKLSSSIDVLGKQVFASASIGIAMGNPQYKDAEVVMRDADNAMHRAKRLNKPYEFFDKQMHQEITKRLNIESELQRALLEKDFQLHYQPLVDICSSELRGFEALIRWQRYINQPLTSPMDFIPIAEETGLIIPIGYWVIEEACKQILEFRKLTDKDIFISVNLSTKQFHMPDLVPQIKNILNRTGVDASLLKIEITEGALLDYSDDIALKINQLKDLGIRLALDDFGKGYSSFARLEQLPFETIKLDQSFVAHLHNGGIRKISFIHAMVLLAKALGMSVIAEGIENQQQQLVLIDLECDLGQGYYFGRPVDAATIAKQLKQSS